MGSLAVMTVMGHSTTLATNLLRSAVPKPQGNHVPIVHIPQIASRQLFPLPKKFTDSNTHFAPGIRGTHSSASVVHFGPGPALKAYEFTHEFKYIIEGETYCTDGTGQTVLAKAGDLIYFPDVVNLTYNTPKGALAYSILASKMLPHDGTVGPVYWENEWPAMNRDASEGYLKWLYTTMRKSPQVHYPQITHSLNTIIFVNEASRLASSNARALFNQLHCYGWDHKESFAGVWEPVSKKLMCAGVIHMQAGPPLLVANQKGREVWQYVLEGEFHITDTTGQKVVAKKGDANFVPRGSEISLEMPIREGRHPSGFEGKLLYISLWADDELDDP